MLLRKPSKQFQEDGKHSAVSVKESGSSRFYQGSGGESLLAAGPAERGGSIRQRVQSPLCGKT